MTISGQAVSRRAAGASSSAVLTTARKIDRVPVPDLCCLWAEEPATPMIIALAGMLDGRRFEGLSDTQLLGRVRGHVAARLHRASMLRRVLLPTRLGQGTMAWSTRWPSTSPTTSGSSNPRTRWTRQAS